MLDAIIRNIILVCGSKIMDGSAKKAIDNSLKRNANNTKKRNEPMKKQ